MKIQLGQHHSLFRNTSNTIFVMLNLSFVILDLSVCDSYSYVILSYFIICDDLSVCECMLGMMASSVIDSTLKGIFI